MKCWYRILLSLNLLLLCLVLSSKARNITGCLANDTNPYLAFATKTSYDYIKSLRSSISTAGVIGCRPVQIWALFRHGTRYPDLPQLELFKTLESLRDNVINNHEIRFNGHLCDKDLDNLRTWRYTLTSDQDALLAPQGFTDLQFIGKRMKAQFPNILNTTYSEEKFLFQHTDTERTKQSVSAFVDGLFGADAGVVIPASSTQADSTLLRPYSNCSAWEEKWTSMTDEKKLFEETDLMKALVVSVSQRLGFLYNLNMTTIETIYDMCRFDKAWNYVQISPWCAAFTKEELTLMEYAEDIKYYYKSSYGNEMNLQLGCPLLKDMFNKFSKTADNLSSSDPVGTFFFSHASMLNMFNARLDLSHDASPLLHSNYEQMIKREFRTTYVVPFATNIAAVLYKCTSGEENQVMFYRNEKLIAYDGCNVGLCSWKMIKNKFAPIVGSSSCSTEFCKGNSGASMLSPVVSLVLGLVTIFKFTL